MKRLPKEIQSEIFDYLPLTSIAALKNTSKSILKSDETAQATQKILRELERLRGEKDTEEFVEFLLSSEKYSDIPFDFIQLLTSDEQMYLVHGRYKKDGVERLSKKQNERILNSALRAINRAKPGTGEVEELVDFFLVDFGSGAEFEPSIVLPKIWENPISIVVFANTRSPEVRDVYYQPEVSYILALSIEKALQNAHFAELFYDPHSAIFQTLEELFQNLIRNVNFPVGQSVRDIKPLLRILKDVKNPDLHDLFRHIIRTSLEASMESWDSKKYNMDAPFPIVDQVDMIVLAKALGKIPLVKTLRALIELNSDLSDEQFLKDLELEIQKHVPNFTF